MKLWMGATLLLGLSLSLPADAKWGEKARQAEREYDSLFENSPAATVWGGLQWGVRRDGKTEVLEKSIEVPGYAKPFRYLVATQKKDKNAVRAPLVVFLPGMFTDVESSRAKRFIEVFGERGYHVLLPPNPWSAHALESFPAKRPGHIEDEAAVMWEFSSRAIALFKKEHGELVSSVNLAGESYGTILAGVFLAIDREKKHPIVNGTTTLFSPVLHMLQTLESVDAMMDRNEKTYASWSAWDTLLNAITYLRADRQEDLSPEMVANGETTLAFEGFGRNLVDSIYALERVFQLGHVPNFPGKAERAQWELGVRFLKSYFDVYTPGLRSRYSKKTGTLRYWLARSGWLANGRLRVMMSADDVVNSDPSEPAKIFRNADLLLLPHGGHSGFLGYPWFDHFADEVFSVGSKG